MEKMALGRTGEEVSALCLGAMFFGTSTPADMSEQLLDRFVDAGGNFVDTANIYATWRGQGGESEALLGEWMKARRNRHTVFLATKVGFPMPDGTGLSAAQIAHQAERSLNRLQIDTIDLYYAHVDDRTTPLDETLEAFDRLIQAGKVRFLGVSNYRPWRLMKVIDLCKRQNWAPIQCIQQRHTFLRPEPEARFANGNQIVLDNDLLHLAAEEGISILAYSVLLGGSYTRTDRSREGYMTAVNEARLVRLRDMARDMKISPNTLVIAWMLNSTPPVLPLVAASTPEQLEENLAAALVRLTPEQMALLNEGLPT
jgi:aryl-alcohol dehydrogenase-like predicted oxidoreductase